MAIIIAIVLLVILLRGIGAAKFPAIKMPKIPNWAKINPANSWGISFFDRHLLLKKVLIKILGYSIVSIMLTIRIAYAIVVFMLRSVVHFLTGKKNKLV